MLPLEVDQTVAKKQADVSLNDQKFWLLISTLYIKRRKKYTMEEDISGFLKLANYVETAYKDSGLQWPVLIQTETEFLYKCCLNN